MPIANSRNRSAACLSFIVLFCLAPFFLAAQSISSCVPNASPAGNTVSVTITGVGVDFNSGTPLVDMKPAVGPTIYANSFIPTSTTTLEATFTIPGSAALGDYSMRVGSLIPYQPSVFTVLGSGATGTISGKVYHDVNENCSQGASEPDLSGFVVHLTPGDYYAMTGASGAYNAYVPPGTYDLDVMPPPHYFRLCPTSSISATIGSVGATSSGNDFAMDPDSVTDGGISCSAIEFRPGFNTQITVQVRNIGVLPFTGDAQIILDTNLSYLSSMPSAFVSDDTVRWTVSPAMQAGEIRNYTVTVNLPVSVPLGTPITNVSSLLTDSPDNFQENNFFACSHVVIGSYDPNDKTVWNQDMVLADPVIDPADSVLIYRIRFQNTGTASAINIFIRDTLDPLLDAGSMEVIGTSHLPYTTNLNGQGSVEWRFPGINLPDSNSNEPASHGFVLFRIKPKPSFAQGMSITNKAHIYFDFNAPIVTNETSTSILVSAEDPAAPFEVLVYPNPASHILRIELECLSPEAVQFKLFDAYGSLLRAQQHLCNGGKLQAEISVEGLSTGIYFLETTIDGEKVSHKIAVTR